MDAGIGCKILSAAQQKCTKNMLHSKIKTHVSSTLLQNYSIWFVSLSPYRHL